MAVAAGTRFGPYEIASPLGAGGMGEVYRARDTKLGRDVAVKVLPAALAHDPAALSRLEREARAVAQLSHPNVLAIFDFGREGQTAFVVTELLEGETLRERLAQGALPVRKSVDLAVQIADALAAAHDKGIVHRDLKPENVFVTDEGRAKLLDFGLAREAGGATSASDSRLQTLERHTDPGTVMGTVGYMSPEQVRGETADHRSDIFSFGAVLYEMLSGRKAFGRDTAAESMTAILKEDPPEFAGAVSASSPALSRIVQHCLEKKRGERFQSARDVGFALQALSGSAVASGPAPTSSAISRKPPWIAVLAIAAAAVLALLAFRSGRSMERRALAAMTFRQMSFQPQAIFQAAFAPDGQTIVYSAALEGNVPELFTVRPGYSGPQPLGLARTHLLSISSTGELAVLTNARYLAKRQFTGTLARMTLGGTAPREILDDVRQADWSPDGTELAVIRTKDGKDRLEFPIGKVLYETAGYLSELRVSRRGERVALFEHPRRWDDRGTVITVDRAGKRTVLTDDFWGEEGLSWSAGGDEILFTAGLGGNDQTVYRVGLSGNPRVVLRTPGGLTMHDVSPAGRWLVTRDDERKELFVRAPGEKAERDVSWLDGSAGSAGAGLSRDGRILLFNDLSIGAGLNYTVCLRTTDGGPVVRLGEGDSFGLSPDGKWALAIIDTPPQLVLYPTGAGEPKRLAHGDVETYQSAAWYPDGKSVLVVGNEHGKAPRCYAQDVSGGLPRPVTAEGAVSGSVSPDGLRILWSKNDGSFFLKRAGGEPDQPVPWLTSGDQVIRWSPDSRSVLVIRPNDMPLRIERLALDSGRRELVRELAPADRAGVVRFRSTSLTDDPDVYAYGVQRMTSHLYVVEGAR